MARVTDASGRWIGAGCAIVVAAAFALFSSAGGLDLGGALISFLLASGVALLLLFLKRASKEILVLNMLAATTLLQWPTLPYFLAQMVLAAASLILFLQESDRVRRRKVLPLLSFGIVFTTLGFLGGFPSEYGLTLLLEFWIGLGIGAMVILLAPDRRMISWIARTYLWVLTCWGCLESLLTASGRIGGPVGSPTAYASILTVAWWFVFMEEKSQGRADRLARGVLLLLAFVVILLTGTRMALLSFVISGLVGRWLAGRNRGMLWMPIKAFLSLGLVVTILLISWHLLPDDLEIKRNFIPLLQGRLDLSSLGRVLVWIAAIQAGLENPYFGIGFGNFYDYCLANDVLTPLIHAHNVLLTMFAETGLVGLSLMAIAASTMAKRLFELWRTPFANDEARRFIVTGAAGLPFAILDAGPLYITSLALAWFLYGALVQAGLRFPGSPRSAPSGGRAQASRLLGASP